MLNIINYDDKNYFVLESIRFWYKKEIFKGTGFMKWNPKKGFRVNALLDKNFTPIDSFKTLGQTIINDKNDAFTIRLNVRGLGFAIIPRVFPLAQKLSLIPDNHLSIAKSRVIFFIKWPEEMGEDTDYWSGSTVFRNNNKIEFFDNFIQTTTIGGEIIKKQSTAQIHHNEPKDFSLTGHQLTKSSFRLDWALSKSTWTKTNAWDFAEATRKSLAIIFGQTIQIAESKIARSSRQIFEFRKKEKVENLKRDFRPFLEIRTPQQRDFTKNAFLKFIAFFLKGGTQADVAWRMFHQMADASRQETWQGRELLLSTILEAALRTLDGKPFKIGDASWRRKESMASFQQKYFTGMFDSSWQQTCEKILVIHTRLRHRNAHPDWLTAPGGVISKEELKQSTKDMITLSRFYGYMILALAGFKDLEPLFETITFSG